MIVIKELIKVPDKKGTYTIKAPFYIQVAKLKALHQIQNSYKRSTHKVESNEDEYEVKKDQDLYTIAKMYNTTWQILAQLNKATIKDPDKIAPGQFIKVPPKGSSLTGKTNERPDSLTSQTHYEVKKGDTLSSISQRSGVSVEQLQRMNGITNPTTLQADQTIKLRSDGSAQTHITPKPPSNPTPKPSSKPSSSDEEENGFFDGAMDAAADITKGTAGAIGGAFETIGNGLGALGNKAKEGLEDLNEAMSGGKNDKPAGQMPGTSSSSSSASGNYTVKSGDTLSGIARKHGVNTNDLARANGLKLTDTIHPGDKLKILTGGSTSSSTSSSSQPSKPDIPVNVTTKPSNSSDGTPKDVATTNGACVCRAHDLIWGGHPNVNCEFRKKVIEICQDLWPNDYLAMANNLMACMYFESARTFNPKKDNKIGKDEDGYGYVGLIQFGNDACTDLSIKKRQLVKMSAVEQLDWVKKYFLLRERNKLITDLVGMYMCINYPKNLVENRMKPKDVVYSSDKKAYRQNPAFFKEDGELDRTETIIKNGKEITKYLGFENGKTYIWEVAEEMQNYYKPGEKKENRSFESTCSQVVQPPTKNSTIDVALWMDVAIREGKEWKGIHEKNITDNYHKLVGINAYSNLVGSERAWCASLVNYCLKETAYPMVTTNDPYDRVRAKSFAKDPLNFIKIDIPIYGAIAVSKEVSHVCFVLGRKNSERFYRLGGNQDQMITVDDKKISTYTYYYPAKAWKRHSKDLAPIISTNSILDKGLNIHASTSTR